MSELTNRAAYLKGLADGMKLDTNANEGKLLAEIINLLSDMADQIDAIDDEQGFIADAIDAIEEDIELMADDLYEDYDDEDDEEDEFQITCEACGEDIILTYEDIMDGEILCPTCGETIEFDFECDCDCEDCDCEDCE